MPSVATVFNPQQIHEDKRRHRIWALRNLTASTLTTAALIDGRQVDIRSVLRWDADRQAWDIRELYLGGTPVPMVGGDE